MKFKEDGDRHFTDQGRVAEITIDSVLQASAKMSENKVKRARTCHRLRNDQTVATRENLRSHKMFSRAVRRCAYFMED